MILSCVFITALFFVQEVRCLKPENCDPSLNNLFREGILGQVGMFPWLGVIRVELHEGVNIRIALTGAILIKEKYALTIADDIARIPKKIFERDSRALFIPTDGEPWLFKLEKYITHPEYPYIKNTIALIKLELENQGPMPLIPICWQTYSYDASSQLYVLGITDVNDVLEKEVHKVQYVQQSKCMAWYATKGFNTEGDESTDYQCVSAVNSKKQCVFETGMVLASNTTGTWTLLGFGIYGPGCASPSRFIVMYKYFAWIESTTNDEQAGRSYETKKGFGDQNVPIHQMFRSKSDPENMIVPYMPEHYEGGLAPDVVRVDRTAIIIFNTKYEMDQGDCFIKSSLIYSDSFKIHADSLGGRVYYVLSLMDLSVMNYTCVLVRVNAGTRSNATLWYNYGDYIEPLEGSETPKELLKKYPLPTRDEEIENQSTTSKSSTTTTEKSRGDHNSNTTPENPGEDKNPNNTPGNPEKDKNSNKSPEQTQEGDDKSPEDRNKNAVPNASRQNHHRHTRRIINSNRRYKKLISDSLINDLQAIKGELETTKIELNIAGKADINKTFKKMLAIKNQLKKVQDKLGSHVSASLKDSINILDKAASELRAGQVFYEEKLMDIRKQEIQQSIDLIKEFREQPDIVKKKIQRKKETFKKPRPRGRQGNKKSWKPHKHLEKQYITDRPGWWLYYPHLNLELDFNFDEEAEMTIEIWSHRKVSSPTKGPKVELFTRTRTAPPNTMPVEITMNYLIAKIDPDKLPPRLSLENAKSLFKEIFPEKVPGNTTLETLPSFIDSEKLPLDIDLTNATDLVLMIFNGLLPASSLRQKIDDTVRYTGSLKSVLRKDSKFERYSELKRVKYYDDIIKTRGIDFFDDNQPDKSDINRSDRSFVVVIVIYVLLSNLDII